MIQCSRFFRRQHTHMYNNIHKGLLLFHINRDLSYAFADTNWSKEKTQINIAYHEPIILMFIKCPIKTRTPARLKVLFA